MKRILALTLAAIFIASVLTACGEPKTATAAICANVRVTSSDAENAAAWLTERLGDAMTGRVVLGTDADGYGVDLSALEADGFLIRAFGGEDVLLAKTADGLDRAARKYAKMVEAGAVTDVTYHEGARIEKLTIAGRDISEYTIYSEDEPNMLAAANELAARIEQACGVKPAVSAAAPAAPYIALRYVHDDALSTVGYRWSVGADGLTLECSDGFIMSSAHFAVVRFLENALGWFGLSFGYETLAEADLVSLDAGESGGETNAFLYAYPYGDQYAARVGDPFDHRYDEALNNNFSGLRHCCHGLQNNRFAAELSKSANRDWSQDQPCYLDETFFEVSYDDVLEFIENKIAAGGVIGENFFNVDIAAGDNMNWCKCKACRKMYADEGSTEAGAVVTWANRISEALDEVHPGLRYGIFAYAGTNKPPKTVRPNDLLAITYCFDMSCDTHPHDGSMCDTDLLNHVPYNSYPHLKDHNNTFMANYLRGWTEICDCVCVWFYGMTANLVTMDFIHTVRSDLVFFHDLGVKSLFWEAEDYGYSSNKAAKWLMSGLVWNIGMTDEEYDAYYDRVLEALYGDGWEYVKEYIAAIDSIYESGPCLHGWGGYLTEPMWELRFDTLYELTEQALPLVCSEKQEQRLMKIDLSCIYSGCVSSFFSAKEAGDEDRLAELERRYQTVRERAEKYGFRFGGLDGGPVDVAGSLAPDLELEAWTLHDAYDWHYTPPTSEMPERVAQYVSETEAD